MLNGDGKTERRKDGKGLWRPATVLAIALLSVFPSFRRLSAQASLQLSLGARYASTVVHDSIVSPFDVRPALAPSVAIALATPLNGPWSAGATLDISWSRLERHDQDGATVDLGGVGTLALTVDLTRRFPFGLEAQAGIGGLKYLPGSESGIFARGTGGVMPLGALGLTYAPPLGARHGLALRARYDIHRFLTPALRNGGFPSGHVVHRVALGVGWNFGGARPAEGGMEP